MAKRALQSPRKSPHGIRKRRRTNRLSSSVIGTSPSSAVDSPKKVKLKMDKSPGSKEHTGSESLPLNGENDADEAQFEVDESAKEELPSADNNGDAKSRLSSVYTEAKVGELPAVDNQNAMEAIISSTDHSDSDFECQSSLCDDESDYQDESDQLYQDSDLESNFNDSRDLPPVKHRKKTEQRETSVQKSATFTRREIMEKVHIDWPSRMQNGVTMKQFMILDQIDADHKAMWISLIQTIVHHPDQKSIIEVLKDLLLGDLTLAKEIHLATTPPSDQADIVL
ncbi:hypothetical protein E4T42_06041 [Aureobasidium subglaciale]|nr:hypothetical protein E4T42_06041 [Aureobasidium subglaciale]